MAHRLLRAVALSPERGSPDLAALAAMLDRHGLVLRSGFNFLPGEDAPGRAVLLVGNAGAGYWQHFQAWLATQSQPVTDPLDTWSRAVIGEAARMAGARAVSPSDKPFQPFQRWAMRAEGLKPSPLGILMHPDYGLWHAYRGALLLDRELPFPETPARPHPCDACRSKPCLGACPVDAYTRNGFAYEACLAHVRSGPDCRAAGCGDRNACPFGTGYRYPAAVQAFHMAAFARL